MQLRLSSSGDTTGRLLLEQGDLAGQCYRFETSICQNPVCQCERVTLRCFPETPQPPSQASIFVCLEMDLAQQDIVNPNCACQEVVLSFFQLRLFAEPSRIPTEPNLSIRYAYNTGRIEPLPGAEDGRLSGQEFVEALRKVLPDLNSLLAKRQALLQR